MAEVNYNLTIDEKLKDKFEKMAKLENRSIASQIRHLMEAYVENRMEIKQ